MRASPPGKIFGIGLPKTGQTSLSFAMRKLGFTVNTYPYYSKQIKESEFCMDLPVVLTYKKLDKKYPNSKFILTTRDYKSWIKSIKNHYRRFPASKRRKALLYFRLKFWGTENFSKKIMSKKYYEHLEDVQKYFEGRKRDLLIMNVVGGDGYSKLCKFLGKKAPHTKFPKENIGVYKN